MDVFMCQKIYEVVEKKILRNIGDMNRRIRGVADYKIQILEHFSFSQLFKYASQLLSSFSINRTEWLSRLPSWNAQ